MTKREKQRAERERQDELSEAGGVERREVDLAYIEWKRACACPHYETEGERWALTALTKTARLLSIREPLPPPSRDLTFERRLRIAASRSATQRSA